MAQIAVIGLGRFGSHVAQRLHADGHEVLAIDMNAAAVQRLRDHSTQAVVLDAREWERLRALGIRDFDVVVLCIGERIDASALVALHLKEIGVRKMIAKVGSEDQAKLLELIGVDEIISPERQAAENLANRLNDANTMDYIPLGANYSINEVIPPAEFIGKSLIELRLRNRFNVQVLGLRDGRTDSLEVNPPPESVIREHHLLILLGSNEGLNEVRRLRRA
jgi:trk system potassium uptake protein TrkA